MIRPSRETLRLQRERDLVDKQLQAITYRHPKKTAAELLPTTSSTTVTTVSKQPSKQENMLQDLKTLRDEYLQNGGNDPKVLAELYQMEKEIVDASSSEISPQIEISRNDGNTLTSTALLANPLLANGAFHHDTHHDPVSKLERELQKIELYREKLIAQHELKILELDLKEEALAMTPAKPKQVDTLGYPLSYIPRRGLCLLLSHLDGWRKFKPAAIQFVCCLFDGVRSIQKFVSHDWVPKADQDDISIDNLIGKLVAFVNVMPRQNIRLIIDIRFTIGNRKDVPFGWTSFELFREDALDSGSWKVPLYQHPVVLDSTPFALKKNLNIIPTTVFYFQIQDGSSSDKSSGTLSVPATSNLDDFKFKEPQMINTYPSTSPTTSPPTLRPTLRKKKNLEKQDDRPPNLVQQAATTTMKEKVVRDVNAKKFAIGFQLTDLTDFPDLDGDTIIRLVVVDTMPDNRIVAFTSSKTELGEEDGSYGWQFGYFHEIGSITGLARRKGVFEIVNKGVVVGSCSTDLFKFSSAEAYDICDGVYSLEVTPTKPFSEEEEHVPILRVRIYKPKFGPPPIQKFSPRLITPAVIDDAFTFVPAQPATVVDLKKLMNVYIAIDSARFLPTNVTVPKVYARIFSKDRGNFVKGVDFTNSISLDNSVYSPSLRIAREIPAKLLDPSCLLILELHTLEYFTRATELVGTCIISLCTESVDASGTMSPAINYGAFQLPLFHVKIDRDFLRNDGNIQKYFRVPCSSILMRILDKDARNIKVPEYQEKIYQTLSRDVPTEYEALIYTFVFHERKEFSIRDRLLSLGDALPKTARHTDESLVMWLTKKFDFDYKESTRIRLIDLSFLATYNPYYGFKLSVDFASNLTQKEVTFAIVSFTPSFYVLGEKPDNQKFADDTMYSKFIDYSSSARSPRWKDGYHWYRNRLPNGELIAVIQLLGISVNQSSGQVHVVSQGWSILPIFASDLFVRHGYFKLPLFDGYASNQAIASIWKEGDYELEDGIHARALKFTSRFGSVNVRLCDGRRGGELDPNLSDCSEEFLAGYAPKFKPSTYSDSMSGLKYRKQSLEDFDKQLTAAFIEATNLPYVP